MTIFKRLTPVLFLLMLSSVQANDAGLFLHVYKDPGCGCCSKWMEHLENEGFETAFTNTGQLDQIKKRFGIGHQHRSCHTAISRDGYLFEGHIPAGIIRQFLAEKPENALGLTVPGMPVGSPGMEMGARFMPYQVLVLYKSGESAVYAEISVPEQQYAQ